MTFDIVTPKVDKSNLVKGKKVSVFIQRTLCSTSHSRCSGMDHSVTCNYTNACLYLISVHQMAPPETKVADI